MIRLADLSTSEKRTLLRSLLQREPGAVSARASCGQQALWYLEQLQPGNTAYNIWFAGLGRGPVDTAALAQAFEGVIARHESLRTTFRHAGGTPYRVVNGVSPARLEVRDAAGWPIEQIRAACDREAHRPFDLERGPLVRCVLFLCSSTDWALMCVAHHTVADLWSLD